MSITEVAIRKALEDWREKCRDREWMHERAARYLRKVNLAFMIPIIVMSSVAGTINIASSAMGNDACDPDVDPALTSVAYLPLILGFMGIGSAVLSTIYNFMKIGESRAAHLEATVAYEKLQREIRVEGLLQDVLEGTYASQGKLLKELQEKLDNASERAPSIPSFVERQLQKAKDTGKIAPLAPIQYASERV